MFDQETKRLRAMELALVKFSDGRKLRIGEQQYDTLSQDQREGLIQEQEKNLEVEGLVLRLMTEIQALVQSQGKLRKLLRTKVG